MADFTSSGLPQWFKSRGYYTAGAGNFDIILDHLSQISELRTTPHASCAVLCLVAMLAGC